eukprot:GHVS01023132.1.p1 GENE.GHVS01023132.1~~GHVS01023132.1.p1  ORF type:complete len:399 (-),score=21.50 GHVS01023132.1:301-1497(-)
MYQLQSGSYYEVATQSSIEYLACCVDGQPVMYQLQSGSYYEDTVPVADGQQQQAAPVPAGAGSTLTPSAPPRIPLGHAQDCAAASGKGKLKHKCKSTTVVVPQNIILQLYQKQLELANSYVDQVVRPVDRALGEMFIITAHRFNQIVGSEAEVKKLAHKLSNFQMLEESFTGQCEFIDASSPEIKLSPMLAPTIGCESPGNTMQHYTKHQLVQELGRGFYLSSEGDKFISAQKQIYVQRSGAFQSIGVGQLNVHFFGPRDHCRMHFGRAKIMQAISKKLREAKRLTGLIRSVMTLVTFARLNDGPQTYDVPDVAVITLLYCLILYQGVGSISEHVERMTGGVRAMLTSELKCPLQELGPNQPSQVTILKHNDNDWDAEVLSIPVQFGNRIVEEYHQLD